MSVAFMLLSKISLNVVGKLFSAYRNDLQNNNKKVKIKLLHKAGNQQDTKIARHATSQDAPRSKRL